MKFLGGPEYLYTSGAQIFVAYICLTPDRKTGGLVGMRASDKGNFVPWLARKIPLQPRTFNA